MEENNKILQELKDISPMLAERENNPTYAVPVSYFEGLAEEILKKVKTDPEIEIGFPRVMPYTTPPGYFANLSATIMQRIVQEAETREVFDELQKISPVLNKINKKPVYSVPTGYFDETKWRAGELKEIPKVRSIRAGKQFYKYAAAAVIACLLAVGMFLFVGKEDRIEPTAAEVKHLSEQEIIDYLKTNSPSYNTVVNNDNGNKKDNEFKNVVSQMSDKEIQRFLEENGEQDEL